MSDTSKKTNRIYRKMLEGISGEKRMIMGFSMFAFAKKLILASLKKENVLEKDLKKKMFLRIYGSDFEKRKLEKILEAF